MNLLFSIDRKVIFLLLSCVRSVLTRGGARSYDIYILHSDLTQEDQDYILASIGPDASCHFVSVPPKLFQDFPVSDRYPQQIYYRIAAPLLLPSTVDRVLYLDVDTVVINSLCPMYETDFDGAYFMACSHADKLLSKFNQVRLGLEKDVPYINSGVMLLNMPVLRTRMNIERIREFALKNRHRLFLPDQDIITALIGEKVLLLDTMKYNLSDRILTLYNLDPTHEKLDLDWVRINSVIIHYCGKAKPWRESYEGLLGIFYKELARGVGGYQSAGPYRSDTAAREAAASPAD